MRTFKVYTMISWFPPGSSLKGYLAQANLRAMKKILHMHTLRSRHMETGEHGMKCLPDFLW